MTELSDLFRLYRFPVGRRLFAWRGVRPIAAELGLDKLVEHIDAYVKHDQEVTVPTAHRWERAKNAKESGEAVALDQRVDRALAAIHGTAKSLAQLPGDTGPASHGREILERAFPGGLAAIVNRSHEEESAAVAHLITLFEGDLAPAVSALGLESVVTELKADNSQLREVLAAEKKRETSWSNVVEADDRGQEHLLETVGLIVAAFPLAGAEQAAKRARLLGPVLRQNEDIRRWRRRRPGVVDVNPETGTVVIDGAPSDQPAGGSPTSSAG